MFLTAETQLLFLLVSWLKHKKTILLAHMNIFRKKLKNY